MYIFIIIKKCTFPLKYIIYEGNYYGDYYIQLIF